MPASMMTAEVWLMARVIGSSRLTVAAGPRPGSTPTAVPTSTPIKQTSRLVRVRETPKPSARLLRRSISAAPQSAEKSARQRHLQEAVEQQPGAERGGSRHRQRDPPREPLDAGEQPE